jgi:hypothetical protein
MGRKAIVVRIGTEMQSQIEAELAIRHRQSCTTEWTVSDWIRAAIQAKLDHAARARAKRRPRKQKSPSSQSVENAGGER